MSVRVTSTQIAEALGIDKRAVLIRAKRSNWPYVLVPVRGGQAFAFELDELPTAVRRKVLALQGVRVAKQAYQQAERPLPAVFVMVIDGEAFEVRRIAS